ncbi:hypothetical protein INS49_004696 [Diaporthe citri]|uniref:uncharacterized protein n=1 Tax=Diaporthe citri TaxID=83186 RepID=UPI001C823E59|nr:uncharacterized protein INS49_004696 [Diaporthe citri]KAG6354678.1 hypothetical protein INS49_004696 [Diaporthe citri]
MEKLDEILDACVAEGAKTTKDELLGAAFVVVNKDGIIYQGSAGRTAPPRDSPRFSPSSFTWVASMTKLATAAAAMQLVERGQVGLDDDVRPLVPALGRLPVLRGFVGADIPFLEDNTAPITLRHLLTHTAGLGYAGGDPDYARWARHAGRAPGEELRGTVGAWEVPLKFPPGGGWYYGTAVDWAGQVVESVSGRALGGYMAENLFGPLGMGDSTFRRDALPHVRDRTVPSSRRDAGTGELAAGEDPFPALKDGDVESGGGGLYTTAADYAKLLQALLGSLAGGEEGALLKKATVEEMVRPQLTEEQRRWLKFLTDSFHDGLVPDFSKGMALDHGISGVINMEDEPGKRKKGSMMWAGLCNGHWFIDPVSGIAATLFTNILPHPDAAVSRVWDELERAVYGDLLPSLGL